MEKDVLSLYAKKREKIIKDYSKNRKLTLLGKWELSKLFMTYFPDKDIQKQDYDIDFTK